MIGRGRDLSAQRSTLDFTARCAVPERLDQHVLNTLHWKSRTRIQALIHEGKILVNGEASKPSRKVRAGDRVAILLSQGTGIPGDYDERRLPVVYEDPWLVVINKPPDLLVHPVGRHVYDTLINYLHHRYRGVQDEDGGIVRPRLCHRIDRDTTGIVVVGKEPHVHRDVQYQFENRFVDKEYRALVAGAYEGDGETLEVPIGEGRCLRSCLEHAVLKESATGIRLLERFADCSLLACVPHTGRQNQIRVHLAAAGFPIVGDDRYGGGPPPAGFPPRYLLHSSRIRLHHPRLKTWLELRAPLPDDFAQLLTRLRPGGRPDNAAAPAAAGAQSSAGSSPS